MKKVEKNNNPGGLPISRGLDLPGVLCQTDYQSDISVVSSESLTSWFSAPRMHRYLDAQDPGALYVWNTRLAKALLEDVDHVEVLLRNFISSRLTAESHSPYWFDEVDRYHFNRPFQNAVKKAKRRIINKEKEPAPDAIIAELPLDNWRFLLTARHESTIWRALIKPANGGMHHFPRRNRSEFENDVALVLEVRNRASHQEPFVVKATPTNRESERLNTMTAALNNTAMRIDPRRADWISANSQVSTIRGQRPC